MSAGRLTLGAGALFLCLTAVVLLVAGSGPGASGPRVVVGEPPPVILVPSFGTAITQCATAGVQCAAALLVDLNRVRRAQGEQPLTLSWALTKRTGQCAGAAGHAQAMAATDSIWHTDPRYPDASFPRDICVAAYPQAQNVGAAWGVGRYDGMELVLRHMMAETPHDRDGCAVFLSTGQDNHACNILNADSRHVGIGLATNAQGGVFLVMSFAG